MLTEDIRLNILVLILLVFHVSFICDLKHQTTIQICGSHQTRIESVEPIEFVPVDSLIKVTVLDNIEICSTVFAIYQQSVEFMKVAHLIGGQYFHVAQIHVDTISHNMSVLLADSQGVILFFVLVELVTE